MGAAGIIETSNRRNLPGAAFSFCLETINTQFSKCCILLHHLHRIE